MTRLWVGSAAVIALILAAGAFATVMVQDGSSDVAAQSDENRRTVSVSGQGQVSVEPDTGYFSVGVEVTSETAEEALAESNATVEAVTSALIGIGIAEDDIVLGSFSIWPEYDYRDDMPVLRGFRVSHLLSVTVQDIDQTGTALSTAVEAGANVINGVSFGVEDPTPALDQAREQAFDNARHKAEELASLSGGTLGVVVSISENSYTPVPIEQYGFAGDAVAEEAVSEVPINPGDSSFTVSIQVTWELN